jgi:putative ABC transport system permease protein
MATGLVRPGSLLHHRYRLALRPGLDPQEAGRSLTGRFPEAGWQIRHLEDAGQNLRRFLNNTRNYLDLIGLSALLIGGVGVANAVRAHLERKARSIAILKCLGATLAQVSALHLMVIGAIGLVSILAGSALGALLPWLLAETLGGLGLSVLPGFYAGPLLRAAIFGVLTTLAFSLPALLRAGRTRPAQLLRASAIEIGAGSARDRWSVGAAGLVLILMVVALTENKGLAASYCAAALVTLIAFRGLAHFFQSAARALRRGTARGNRALRFALAAIERPGAPVASIVLSIGLGLTVLIAVALIQGSVREDLARRIPDKAPSFYFIDIQPDQIGAFESLVKALPEATAYQSVPMLRGRIVRMAGADADTITPPPELAWVLRGDRGITWSARPPEGAEVVEGEWWPADYEGEPLISLDEETAQGFGLSIGDAITVNVLGREITGKIANLRRIDWSSLSINFVMVFSPGLMESAPQTSIATVRVPAERRSWTR